MRPKTAAMIAVAVGLVIRLLVLTQASGISLEGFETMTHAEHIADTGLPLRATQEAWGGAIHAAPPLLPYLIAFFSILLADLMVGLVLPNLLAALTPIPVMLLAREATKDERAIATATIASAFIPALYAATIDVSPLTIALPLFLLSYYYFIRLAKTPRDQIAFVMTSALLAFTHPIALILPASMIATLIIVRVQKTPLSRSMAEATIFASVLTLWAAFITYQPLISNAGAKILYQTTASPGLTTAASMIGILPLALAAIAAAHYLSAEKNLAVHALTAAIAVTAILTIARMIPPTPALLLIGALVTALAAPGIELAMRARDRSRTPTLHTAAYALVALMFLVTSALPAIAQGEQSLQAQTPQEALEITELIVRQAPSAKVHWDQEHGFLLQYAGLSTTIDSSPASAKDSQQMLEQLSAIEQAKSEVRVVEILAQREATILVVHNSTQLPITERCFRPIHKGTYEVYHRRCVVQ